MRVDVSHPTKAAAMGDVQFLDVNGLLDLVIAVLGVVYVTISLLMVPVIRHERSGRARPASEDAAPHVTARTP